jgi:hypothetical protein
MTDGCVGPHGGAALRARSLTLMLTSLLIAVPFTVGVWGTFWLVRRHRRYAWMPGERRQVWWAIGSCVIILAELTVFGGVAADR